MEERTRRKIRQGKVVSDKMDKTVVVAVENLVRHPLYGRTLRRTNRDGTQRPRMRIGGALVIHRHVEEARGAEGFARRLDFLEMTPERFLALVETEDGLERRRPGARLRRVADERIIQTMTNRALECLMQDPPPRDLVQLIEL